MFKREHERITVQDIMTMDPSDTVRSLNARKRAEAAAVVKKVPTFGDGSLPPTTMWQVRRILLSRPKTSSSTDIVRREAKKIFMGSADPELEWFIQVSVYSGTTIAFLGELALPDPKDNPEHELDELVEAAHHRAAFLNANMVELPGDRVMTEEEYRAARA